METRPYVSWKLIGITGTNARPSIAPTFGVENMMGTNPLTFALPTDEEFPFCIDCATSIVQRGKIEYYAREGKSTPAGMVVSENGEAMMDSNEILKALVAGKAALAPLGGIGEEMCGYKGYGYAAVVEILSAALSGDPFMKALTGLNADGSSSVGHDLCRSLHHSRGCITYIYHCVSAKCFCFFYHTFCCQSSGIVHHFGISFQFAAYQGLKALGNITSFMQAFAI